MILEEYINQLIKKGSIRTIRTAVSKDLEIAGILKCLEPKPALFEKVKESSFRVAGNLFCTKQQIADYFGIGVQDIIPTLAKAIEKRSPPELIDGAPCQEVTRSVVDLNDLPILRHNVVDGGPYISSAVVVAKDPEYGQNLDFHRAMQIDSRHFSVRIVSGRDFHKFLQRAGELDAAFCVGNTPEVLIAAATSVKTGIDELEIANALRPIRLTHASSVDLRIPADCEFVLEGRVYLNEKAAEGPFIDLTETVDVVRQEPVFEVKRITHRRNAIWQALLPGRLEHKILMGMPREPTIYQSVREKGVQVLDVSMTPGGASWLHVAVKIKKQKDDDGKLAIEGAFRGHTSAKHVWVYDDDIDIYDEQEREWAMATRFQGDSDMIVRGREPGSSLDPSAEPDTKLTTKIGFDCTKKLTTKGKSFEKAKFHEVDIRKYSEE
ncbi:MAG: UbiD family decarboxylase [Candidatus Thorarchaeota archaeon]